MLDDDKRHEFSLCTFSSSLLLLLLGNVAWAHVCAKLKFKTDPKNISGLPIFITDDTPVTDTVRLTQRINADMESFKIKPTSWSIPYLICYLVVMFLEIVVKFINLFTPYHVKYCPRGMLAFASSFVLYDRLRSSIALEYEPIYTTNEGFSRSAKWYDSWYQRYKARKQITKKQTG
jgi:3beta-hydroxy-delta5-steroid dehydrogenase / steroid delta-isomerase